MTGMQTFIDMLTDAQARFNVKQTKAGKDIVEIDGGNGAVCSFEFSREGILLAVDLDKDAY